MIDHAQAHELAVSASRLGQESPTGNLARAYLALEARVDKLETGSRALLRKVEEVILDLDEEARLP